MNFVLNKKIIVSFTFIVVLSFFYQTVFAAWNGTFYDPGDTLNPECLPTDPDCDVRSPLTAVNIDDTAYGVSWDADATHAPSKNALYDKIEGLVAGSHDPITLGTANGLSLIAQVLSLGLASSTTTGALSDTDWNTFNNKQDALTADVDYLTPGTATSTYEPLKGVDDNYVTDAEKIVIGNTSGTNSGDNAVNTLYSGLVSSQWTTSVNDIYYNTGNVGIGTATPRTKLEIGGDGAMLATGTFGAGWTEPNLGAGTRMFFYPRKSAFRAGYVDGTQWNNASIGDYSIAMGRNTTASGWSSVAIGSGVVASGDQAIAMGDRSTASGQTSLAIGTMTTAGNYGSVALGVSTDATGHISTALGNNTTASGFFSTTMGSNTRATAYYSTALGYQTNANSYASVALGQYNVGGGNISSWVATDSIFEIGIGTASNAKANALTVLKNGNVGIGTTSPGELLSLGSSGTTKGVLSFAGNTSGKIIIQPAAAAGTYTLTLPTSLGSPGQVLTDVAGDGVLSWTTPGVGGSQTPWTSNINAAGYTLFGNSTVSGNLTLDSTSHATKGNVLINPTGGNVGIGTTTPLRKFEQNGGKFLVYSSDQSWGQFQLLNPNSTEVSFAFAAAATPLSDGTYTTTNNNFAWGFGAGTYGTSPDNFQISNLGYGGIILNINTNGRMGIGTTDAFAGKLHVNKAASGALGGDVWITNSGIIANGSSSRLAFGSDATTDSIPNAGIESIITNAGTFLSDLAFKFYDGVGYNEKVRIQGNTGNVGIGTTSPAVTLHSSGPFRVSYPTHSAGYQLTSASDDTTATLSYYSDATTKFSDILTATYTGNVGIGTVTPEAKLDIRIPTAGVGKYSLILGQSTVSGIVFEHTSPVLNKLIDWGWGVDLGFSTMTSGGSENANQLYLKSNGRVGIGTSNPAQQFEIYKGTGSSGISLTTNSDGFSGPYVIMKDIGAGGHEWVMIARHDTGGYYSFYPDTNYGNGLNISAATSNILIGTSNGTLDMATDLKAKLAVQGNVAIGSGYRTTAPPTNGAIIEGSVGIGTTSPGEILQVGNATENSTNRKTLLFGVGGYSSPGAFGVNSNGDKIIFYKGADFDGRFGISSGAEVWTKSVSTNSNATDGSISYYTGNGSNPFGLRMNVGPGGSFALGGSITSYSNYTGASLIGLTNGNVGIGTTSPSLALHISKSTSDAVNGLLIENTNIGSNAAPIIQLTSSGGTSQIYRTSNAYLGGLADSLIIQENGGGDIIFFNNGNQSMTLKATTGNVGIGNTTPGSLLHVGNGTSYLTYGGHYMRVIEGSVGSPVTTSGPTIEITKFHNIDNTVCGGNQFNDSCATAMAIQSIGAATTTMQTSGIRTIATTLSTSGSDAFGISARGHVNGSGTGIGGGAYLEGYRDTTTGYANGAEITTWNDTASDCTYDTVGFSRCIGLWLASRGLAGSDTSSAIQVDDIDGSQFSYGIGFNPGSVKDVSLYDNSSSTNSIFVDGTHTYALLTGATAGNTGIGDTTPDALLDVKGTVCLDLNADDVCTDNTAALSDSRLKTKVIDIQDSLSLV
ncbi:MAG: hypothetical protein WA060_00380, partial [Minisyncoccia bacterium]